MLFDVVCEVVDVLNWCNLIFGGELIVCFGYVLGGGEFDMILDD